MNEVEELTEQNNKRKKSWILQMDSVQQHFATEWTIFFCFSFCFALQSVFLFFLTQFSNKFHLIGFIFPAT